MTQYTVHYWDNVLSDFTPIFKSAYVTVLDSDTSLDRMGTNSVYNTNSGQWGAFVGEAFQSYYYYTKLSSLSTAECGHFSIYPNPAKACLFINSPTIETATIYDILGKKVLEINRQKMLDISPLSKGVYFVRVSNCAQSSPKKFIKN